MLLGRVVSASATSAMVVALSTVEPNVFVVDTSDDVDSIVDETVFCVGIVLSTVVETIGDGVSVVIETVVS